MNDDDNYAFVMHNEAHSMSICKWIMDSGSSKHMILCKTTFDMYEVITPRNVYLGDNRLSKLSVWKLLSWKQF